MGKNYVCGMGLVVGLALGAGCVDSAQAPAPAPIVQGNSELGIARFEVVETASKTTVVGRDDAGAEVARMELIHGSFTPSAAFADTLGTDAIVGRKVDVAIGTKQLSYENLGFAPVMKLPPLTGKSAVLATFLADPHVKPVLDQWKLGWEQVDANDESAYFNTQFQINGTGSYSCTGSTCSNFTRSLTKVGGGSCTQNSQCDGAYPNGYGSGWTCNTGNGKCEKTMSVSNCANGAATSAGVSGTFQGFVGKAVALCCYASPLNWAHKYCPSEGTVTNTGTAFVLRTTSCGDLSVNGGCQACPLVSGLDYNCNTWVSGNNIENVYGWKEPDGNNCWTGDNNECYSGQCNLSQMTCESASCYSGGGNCIGQAQCCDGLCFQWEPGYGTCEAW